jgi:hypothetical protein
MALAAGNNNMAFRLATRTIITVTAITTRGFAIFWQEFLLYEEFATIGIVCIVDYKKYEGFLL